MAEQIKATETAEAPEVEVQSQSTEQSQEDVQETTDVESTETSEDAGEKAEESEPQDAPQSEDSPVSLPKEFGSKEEWLSDLIRRGEENPSIVYDETPGGELDILQEYYDGKLKPATPKKKAQEKDEDDSSKEEDSTEESKEDSKTPEAETKDEEVPPSSLDSKIMNELGAKNKGEILEKIKGFRKAISGKLEKAPEFQQLKKDNGILNQRMKNEIQLWEDFRSGKPEAIEYVKKNYIPDLPVSSNKAAPSQSQQQPAGRLRVDESEFIDENGAKHINGVLDNLYNEIEAQKKITAEIMAEKTQHKEAMTHEKVESTIVDEMVLVAERLPHLNKVKNIRESIVKWRSGVEDPRMEYFNDLFEIANKYSVSLPVASDIDRGQNSVLEIERAKSNAKKEVYDRKPNRSLSDVQGKTGDFKQFSDAEIQSMVHGDKPMPESWFDDNDNPVASRIPKRAHRFFGIQ